MSVFEASFKVRHECPYRDLSERFPGLTVREWHLADCQVLELSAPDGTDGALLSAIDELGTVLHVTTDDAGAHAIVRACACSLDETIVHRFEAHNCLYVPPTVYQHGWEHYSVLAFAAGDVEALLADLDADREIEVLSKTAVERREAPLQMLFTADRLFDGMTDRQLEALRVAIDNGYFEQPRGASIADLAAETTVARATYEEHLRKAQNKLLRNVSQFVRLVSEQAPRTLRATDAGAVAAGSDD